MTKVILQIAQKTSVDSHFIDTIFYKEGGKDIMMHVIEIISKILDGQKVLDILPTPTCDSDPKDEHTYILTQVCDYIKNHSEDYELEEIIRPTRTRSESSFSKGHIIDWINKYVHLLWTGIQERLKYFDKDGTTCWSEAPAEGVFFNSRVHSGTKDKINCEPHDQTM